MPEFVAVRESGNEVLVGEWPKLLMPCDLMPLLTIKLLSLDSGKDPDTSVLSTAIFSVEGK